MSFPSYVFVDLKETEGVLRLAASWLMASCCLLESKRDLRQDKQKRVG
jgi:hypothetical protein